MRYAIRILLPLIVGSLPAAWATSFTLPEGNALSSPREPSRIADEVIMQSVERGFEKTEEQLPPDETLEKVANRLAGDEVAFAFVRDKISLQSYPASLRGAEGTLRAGAGNSLDRAALLLAILRHHERPVRLARANVSDEIAEKLYERIVSDPVFRPDANGAFMGQVATRALAAYAPLRNAALATTAGLIDPSAIRSVALQELKDHWWVEVEKDGEWVALDSSLREAQPGDRLADAEEHFDELPEAFLQQVAFRVVAEIFNGSEIHRESVLEHLTTVAEASTSVIVLARTGEAQGGGLGNVLGQAIGMQSYVPALRVGGSVIQGSRVHLSDEKPAGGGGLGGALSGVTFGGEEAGGADEDPASSRQLVGLVLEIESIAPGSESITSRRLLYDRLLGNDRHRWESAGRPVEFKVEPQPANDAALTRALGASHIIHLYHGSHNPGGWAKMTENLFLDLIAESPKEELVDALPPAELWQNLQSAQWRALPIINDLFVATSANDLDGLRFYAARPRVAVISSYAPEGEIGYSIEVDLMQDELRVAARDGIPAEAIAERQLWIGTLAGALECELGQLSLASLPEDAISSVQSATLIRDAALSAEPSDRQGVAHHSILARNGIAVIDANGSIGDFWEIQPVTGATRATSPEGLGRGKVITSLAGKVNHGVGFHYISPDELRYLEYLLENSHRIARRPPPPPANTGGPAGEYISLTDTIYSSVILSAAFGVETCICMMAGTVAIVDGLRGKDWTNRFK